MAIVTIGGIPVYDAIITDEETGMFKISLVDDPAVMSNFLAFDNTRKAVMYKVENEEKRLVRGVVMRADFPIYRYDQRFGEYYIIYKADQIRIMAEKYLLESRQNDVNLMHEDGSDVDGVQMVQYFIKGDGISVEGFDDIADGSLFAEFHIVNDDVWNAILEGSYKGFSLEGVFDLVPEQDATKVEEIVDTLDGAFSKIFNNTKEFTMSKMKRFKAALLKALAEFANVTTDKGILAWDGDEDLKVGDAVYIEDAEGNRTPAEDGEYKTDDNKTIVVAEGRVAEILDPEVEVDAPEADETAEEAEAAEETAEEATEETAELASVATDKGELLYEGELAVGTEVFVADAEGNQTPAEDGDYVLEDGTTLKVAEGKVAEFVEAEPVAEETPEEAEDVASIKAENESLKAEIAELKKQIETLQAQPMAMAAHEEVITTQKFEKTGDKGLDRLAGVLSK
jgi:hypothetical protein